MMKAELGDILYIVIFAVVIIAGLLEKVAKSKRQQQAGTPRPSQPYDDFENVEEQPTSGQAPPKTLEEMMRRMLETVETPEQKKAFYPQEAQSSGMNTEEAQSSEYIPILERNNYHPEKIRIREQSEKITFSPVLIEEESVFQDYEFDIRQAVISSEILNRKYA